MNTKKLAIFGASGVVLAGVLVYALGIYPPASGRDGRGAIGQRNVYRADQPADASVDPNNAPVATADELKNAVTLQNGQMFQLNGQLYQLQGNQMVAMQSGAIYRMADGQMVQLRPDGLYAQMNGKFMERLNADQLAEHLHVGQVIAANGLIYQLNNGNMLALKNQMNDRMQDGIARQ